MGDENPSMLKLMGNCLSYHWKGIATIVIPLLMSPVAILMPGRSEFRCMFLILICCFYWITECIPLYVTSLLPIFALPALNLLSSEKTCQNYFKDVLVMFLTSLFIAISIEYCNLHKRLALKTILLVGCSPRKLHLGIILVTSFISMWISNSAATAMMCPIVKAVLQELEANNVIDVYMPEEIEPAVDGKKHLSRIAMAFYFGAAYGATLGGCGTLIGTGTNLTFKGIYDARFPDSTEPINFPTFMFWSVPMVIVDVILLYLFLNITHLGLFRPKSKTYLEVKKGAESADTVKAVVTQKYSELGPISLHEIQVLFWFSLMVILLFTRKPGFMAGWADFLNAVEIRTSASIVISLLALFVFPTTCFCCAHLKGKGPYPTDREKSLMSWEFIHSNTPWSLVFLLGGGFALAEGSQESGMAKLLGEAFSGLSSWPEYGVQFIGIFVGTFLTNFSANVPICNLLVPVLCEVAVVIKMNPIQLIFPAGIACSMAFHLPVGTPPNAIIAGYAGIKTKYMAEAGIFPSIFTMAVLMLNVQTVHRLVYPSTGFPEWATPPE